MPSRNSDKWNQLYFLKYYGDEIIDESAEMYTKFFGQVPANHKLTTGESGGGWTNVRDGMKPFQRVTIADKLFIVSHGEANGEIGAGKNAGMLVQDLKRWGLTQVGLITFKCCNLGRGAFLELFVSACSIRGITVGWAKGYTGTAVTFKGLTGGPSEFIQGDHNFPKFGNDRFKIAQGNHPTPLEKFERYSYKEDEKPDEQPEPKPKTRTPFGFAVANGKRFGNSIWESRMDKK